MAIESSDVVAGADILASSYNYLRADLLRFIDNNDELRVAATKKIYLDGGGDTYIYEDQANRVILATGGTSTLLVGSFGGVNNALGIGAGARFFLDGGGDTYIHEVSANSFEIVVGGVNRIWATATGQGVTGDFHMVATKKFYLDGGGDTYITESAANVISFYANGILSAYISSSLLYALQMQATNGIYVSPTGVNYSNYLIHRSSSGSGTATLYIGNASINVTSDLRLKKNIRDTNLDCLNAINNLHVIDYNWNDPTDKSQNNRNSRGLWTGLLAQEVIDILPYVVNAPDKNCIACKTGNECKEHSSFWHIEYHQIVPVLIKAVQILTERIKVLEAK